MSESTMQDNGNLIFCSDCGKKFSKRAANCPECGAPNTLAAASPHTVNVTIAQTATKAVSSRSRLVYIILALFLGLLGIHNFYAGYTGTGIIQLLLSLTAIGVIVVFFWVILDIIATTKDGQGLPFC